MYFVINSTAPVTIIPGCGGCDTTHNPHSVQNESNFLSLEWKSATLEVESTIIIYQFHVGAQVNFSYKVMNYTLFAMDWRYVHPNRVFMPLYRIYSKNTRATYNHQYIAHYRDNVDKK